MLALRNQSVDRKTLQTIAAGRGSRQAGIRKFTVFVTQQANQTEGRAAFAAARRPIGATPRGPAKPPRRRVPTPVKVVYFDEADGEAHPISASYAQRGLISVNGAPPQIGDSS
jgi:hypothetical protein